MNWVPGFFRRRRLYNDLAEEMRLHLEERAEQLMREGMSRNEAEQAARRAFGSRTLLEERSRVVWQWPTLESIWADVRFALRQLRKSPGFTSVTLLTLALGVGANTSIFSLVNGLLLRPLPVPNAERLTVLRRDENGVEPRYGFSAPFFRGLEARHEVFSDVFAYFGQAMQVRGSSGNETIPGMLVSGEFSSGLRTPPFIGRYLMPQDDRTGGNPAGLAVVISEQFWERWFGRAPDVVGRPLRIANATFTVVGVTPKGFSGADPLRNPELYLPLSAEPITDAPQSLIESGYDARWLTVMARLRPGVSLEKANAELLTISSPILRQQPNPNAVEQGEKNHLHFAAEPGSRGFTYIRALFRKPLVAVFSMCGALLLLACLNVAGLLLARAAARERELATRLGLGATRWRLIRQLMVESLLIATLGTAAGLAISPLVGRSLAALLMSGTPDMHLDSSLDMRVFGFAALTAIAVALAMGLVPALRTTSGNLNEAMKSGQQTQATRPRHKLLPRILLASEVSLALMLVVGAGLLATSLNRLQHSGVGFEPQGLANIAFSMDKQPLAGNALGQLYRQIAEGLSRQPGVKSVSFQLVGLFTGGGWDGNYAVQGQSEHRLYMNSIGPNYFGTMRIPVFEGREFSWDDTSQPKIILNQAAAQLLFPGQDSVGHFIFRERDKTALEVVAVVGNAKYDDLRASPPAAGYVPMMAAWEKPSYAALVRVEGPVVPLATAARKLAAQLAPEIPAPLVTTIDHELSDSIGAERMMALLAVFFAACALLVTAIGLYGTLAYATARRTKEIGIRIALGARRGQVVGLVFGENIWVAAGGSLAGLGVALLTSRALASFLYGTSVRDPWVLVGSVAALTIVSSAASILPALRAARTEPMLALRIE
jgi:putative ABC transport system permease protein